MSSARLLILGVLIRKQPIHGYDVRRELEMWNAEQWTNIAYGSIYFALNKMAEEGLVEVVSNDEQSGKRAGRTEYLITEKGKAEFERLLRQQWWEPRPTIDPFMVAITFMNALPHEELLLALRFRINLLHSIIPGFSYKTENMSSQPGMPRHIIEQLHLSLAHMQVELNWLETTLTKVEQGELP